MMKPHVSSMISCDSGRGRMVACSKALTVAAHARAPRCSVAKESTRVFVASDLPVIMCEI